ncbi:MAG: hypothetical protein ABJF10_30255 [Chthoniobacter sp.]|uniref:hypothetical protein n=1 Tax=Chthoniobacter sp. TaxID=2510640 RepID=UPI0032A73FE2
MAIVLEANYAKKLGLPNFSSHQYSVTIRTELTDLTQVEEASTRLYGLLQDAVDREIQEVGFMPDASRYGMNNGNGNGNGHTPSAPQTNGNGHRPAPGPDGWACTEGQQKLVLQLVHDHQLDKADIEALAQQLFGIGVKELNKMQASNLIDELLEKVGKKGTNRRPRWQNRQGARS